MAVAARVHHPHVPTRHLGKIMADWQCACGAPLLPIAGTTAYTCVHCDDTCEKTNCQKCKAFIIGSRYKGLAQYIPRKMWA